MEEYIIVQIPRKMRILHSLLMLVVTLVISGFVVRYLYSNDRLDSHVLFILPFFCLGSWQSLHLWRTVEKRQPTLEAKQREAKLAAQAERARAEREAKWLSPIATGFAVLVGIMTFFGCWIYAVATYGWFLGLAFGWIPSMIIAWIAVILSPLIGILLFLGLLFFLSN
ncbi:MAG: hypothetical protein ACXWTT_01800 [Methylobacter sp.]